MTLKKKVYDLYKKIYKRYEELDSLQLASMFTLLAEAAECCSDTEEQLGSDVYNLVKKYTKVRKRCIDVKISEIICELNKSEQE